MFVIAVDHSSRIDGEVDPDRFFITDLNTHSDATHEMDRFSAR